MKDRFFSDEHVAAVNGAVQQILGADKHVLIRHPQCITIGEVLRGFYKRSEELKGYWGLDPWGINYATGLEIENSKIFDSVVAAMKVATEPNFLGQQLVRKVGKLGEIHPHDDAERSYFQKGSPFWIMTETGRVFYETLALPPKDRPASTRRNTRSDSGAMAPTAVA